MQAKRAECEGKLGHMALVCFAELKLQKKEWLKAMIKVLPPRCAL